MTQELNKNIVDDNKLIFMGVTVPFFRIGAFYAIESDEHDDYIKLNIKLTGNYDGEKNNTILNIEKSTYQEFIEKYNTWLEQYETKLSETNFFSGDKRFFEEQVKGISNIVFNDVNLKISKFNEAMDAELRLVKEARIKYTEEMEQTISEQKLMVEKLKEAKLILDTQLESFLTDLEPFIETQNEIDNKIKILEQYGSQNVDQEKDHN